jgi:ethanolamine ammonia-lyase small subunit
MADKELVINPWHALRRFTSARIALGRAGISQPTGPQLEFQLAHARARDAVHLALETEPLQKALIAGLQPQPASCVVLHSAAETRHQYLQRPDLGRKLDAASREVLEAAEAPATHRNEFQVEQRPYDLAIVIADGLSALSIDQNALPFLQAFQARIAAEKWTVAPLAIVQQARVAIGDEIGELLGAKAVVVMIGERPGLTSPDSMGLYVTWWPRIGLTDESRNCISNVRPAGLSYQEAAFKLHWLLAEARKRQLTGIALKDETAEDISKPGSTPPKFLF